jgi:hypothetical protein
MFGASCIFFFCCNLFPNLNSLQFVFLPLSVPFFCSVWTFPFLLLLSVHCWASLSLQFSNSVPSSLCRPIISLCSLEIAVGLRYVHKLILFLPRLLPHVQTFRHMKTRREPRLGEIHFPCLPDLYCIHVLNPLVSRFMGNREMITKR